MRAIAVVAIEMRKGAKSFERSSLALLPRAKRQNRLEALEAQFLKPSQPPPPLPPPSREVVDLPIVRNLSAIRGT